MVVFYPKQWREVMASFGGYTTGIVFKSWMVVR